VPVGALACGINVVFVLNTVRCKKARRGVPSAGWRSSPLSKGTYAARAIAGVVVQGEGGVRGGAGESAVCGVED